MSEAGKGKPEGLIEKDLPGGIGEVVFPADDVGDLHQGVIHHGGEVIGRSAIGAHDDEILEKIVLKYLLPMDDIVQDGSPFRDHKAQ